MRDILTVGLGKVLQLLAAVLSIRLLTTLMNPEQVGQINQFLSVGALAASGVIIPVIVYFARGLTGWKASGQLSRKLLQILTEIAVLSSLLTICATLMHERLLEGFGQGASSFAMLYGLYVFGFSAFTLLSICASVLGQRVRNAIYANLSSWGGLALAAMLFVRNEDPWAWVAGISTGYLIASQGLWFVGRKNTAASPLATDPLSFRPSLVFRFVWPQVLFYLFWWVQSQSYRFALAEVSSVASVGLFFAAYALVSVPLQAFESAFSEVYSPTLFREIEGGAPDSHVRAWNRYVQAYLPCILIFGVFLAGCAPHMARLVLGQSFQVDPVFYVLPAFAEVGRALASVNHTLGVAKLDMRRLLPPAVVGAVLSPCLVLALGPRDPLFGTGFALCVASIGVLAVVYAQSMRTPGIEWPWRRMGFTAMISSPLVVAGVFAHVWLPNTPGYAVAACMLLAVYSLGCLYAMSRPWLRHLREASRD
jgi:O-antigen/teichoic acid export membrane protein